MQDPSSFLKNSRSSKYWAVLQRPEAESPEPSAGSRTPGPFLPVWQFLWQAGSGAAFLTDTTAAKLMRAATVIRKQWLLELSDELKSFSSAAGPGTSGDSLRQGCSILMARIQQLRGLQGYTDNKLREDAALLSQMLGEHGQLHQHPDAHRLSVWQASLLHEGSNPSWPSPHSTRAAIQSAQQQLTVMGGAPGSPLARIDAALDAITRVSKIIPAALDLVPETLQELEADFWTVLNDSSKQQDLSNTRRTYQLQKWLEDSPAAWMVREYERVQALRRQTGMC